jgi:hypothetical protein
MGKTLLLMFLAVVIVGASAPAITGLLGAAAPLVLTTGAVLVVLRVVWFWTERR